MGDQHHHALRHHRHGLEVPDRVVGEVLPVERHRADHRPDVSHHQVVAVGRRFGDDVGGDGAAGAGAAVDDHRRAPALGEFLGEVAREVIGCAARALAEDAYRPRRVARGRVLRVRERGGEKNRCCECKGFFHMAAHLSYRGAADHPGASRHPSSYEEGKNQSSFAPPLLVRGGEKSVELRATPPRTRRGKISRASRHPSSYEEGKNQSSFAPPLLVRGGEKSVELRATPPRTSSGKISRASRHPFSYEEGKNQSSFAPPLQGEEIRAGLNVPSSSRRGAAEGGGVVQFSRAWHPRPERSCPSLRYRP